MKLFTLLIACAIFQSCAICKPPRNNAEMEQRVRKHDRKPFVVRQWWKPRGDGYWIHHRQEGFREATNYIFECRLDSTELERFYDSIASVRHLRNQE